MNSWYLLLVAQPLHMVLSIMTLYENALPSKFLQNQDEAEAVSIDFSGDRVDNRLYMCGFQSKLPSFRPHLYAILCILSTLLKSLEALSNIIWLLLL